ncbi:hypothetical protein A3709_19965 [Halioglobus sp. HI00S01]|uniref:hypothetical protein n=1 Tax=Halioglobus sp. HI00S01 TaxID=1822214 RepID=UPI0007C2F6E5|nr:hypothetical protein [Halioglobus sp. HI00S01]KZX57902.1 hypothetical protein A3709_19965 [Halioglobus sp. HI00S01]
MGGVMAMNRNSLKVDVVVEVLAGELTDALGQSESSTDFDPDNCLEFFSTLLHNRIEAHLRDYFENVASIFIDIRCGYGLSGRPHLSNVCTFDILDYQLREDAAAQVDSIKAHLLRRPDLWRQSSVARAGTQNVMPRLPVGPYMTANSNTALRHRQRVFAERSAVSHADS